MHIQIHCVRADKAVRAPLTLLLAALILTGCTTPKDPATADARAFAAPTQLTATLVDPINIKLRWKDNATHEAGYFVEYSPDANNEWAIIEALPPNTTRYHHSHLLPHTRFVYRVRPFFGQASNAGTVTTGKPLPNATITNVNEIILPATGRFSLRSVQTIDQAAPSDLTAAIDLSTGVKLQWQDNSSDEDEYLVEIKPGWDSRFHVSAFVEPNTTAWTSYDFPPESKFSLRVRAFFYGQPSNVAEATTGEDPSMPGGKMIQYEGTPPAK